MTLMYVQSDQSLNQALHDEIIVCTWLICSCQKQYSSTPPKITPRPTRGYIYLYSEDDLVHFCWRQRSASLSHPELDLVMVPSDGHFTKYQPPALAQGSRDPANGRIYVLKFSSSSQRHLFWLQSKSQHPQGDPTFHSTRDQKLAEIVDQLLQGEDVDVEREVASMDQSGGGNDDETMEDVDEPGAEQDHHRAASGGAGAGATGGDVRDEGEESREGGADGGRA